MIGPSIFRTKLNLENKVNTYSQLSVSQNVDLLITRLAGPTLQSLPPIPQNMQLRVANLSNKVDKHPHDKELKTKLFSLTTSHLFESLNSLDKKSFVIMGMVHNDGVGDYYHILEAVEIIKKQFPEAKIMMFVAHMDEKLPSGVRLPDSTQIETVFCQWQKDLPPEILERLHSTDQIIEMSQKVPITGVKNAILQHPERHLFIGEYSHSTHNASMGLNDAELGIIIKESPKTSSLNDLKNELLKTILFDKTNPSENEVNHYMSTHEPFTGYLKMGSYYQMGLIYTAAALQKDSHKQFIDMMIPPVHFEYLDLPFLKAQGVGKIIMIKKENGQVVKQEHIINNEGKELRLISIFPLEQQDFHTLLAYSNPLVGCTGDHSLSEVISFQRLPFYELRPMKTTLVRELIELASLIGTEPHYLKLYFEGLRDIFDSIQEKTINFLSLMQIPGIELLVPPATLKEGEKVLDYFIKHQPLISAACQKIADILKHPEILNEIRLFDELLKSQFSFNKTLKDLVSHQLAISAYPELGKSEQKIKDDYVQGHITLRQALEQLIEKIKNISM